MRNRDVDRRITKGFVGWSPDWVVLTPNTRIKTLSGGWTTEAQPARDPQVFTIIEASNKGDGAPAVTDTSDGTERTVSYVLVGSIGVEIAVGDTFTVDGSRHIIAHVLPDNGYEIRALAVRHA